MRMSSTMAMPTPPTLAGTPMALPSSSPMKMPVRVHKARKATPKIIIVIVLLGCAHACKPAGAYYEVSCSYSSFRWMAPTAILTALLGSTYLPTQQGIQRIEPGAIEGDQRTLFRSEEHTSELQSREN